MSELEGNDDDDDVDGGVDGDDGVKVQRHGISSLGECNTSYFRNSPKV
jgi:hypothetical protein